MHVKKIYRNEAVEGQLFNLTNTTAALSKATGLDWSGTQFGRVIYATVNWPLNAKKTISVEDAFKAIEAGKQAAKDAGWRVADEPLFRESVIISKGPFGADREFKTFDEYKKWATENPKVADVWHVIQIGFALRDGLKKKESAAGSPARFFDYIKKVDDACKQLNLSPKVANALNAGENWVLELLLKECGRPYRQGKSPEAAAKAFVDAISRELELHDSPAFEARRYNYGAMTKDGFVQSAVNLYLKSLKRRKIDPEDGYEIEDLMDTLSDSGLYLEEWVIAHIGLPKGEEEETYDAWMDERPEVAAVIDAIMDALKEKGYSVE